MWNTELTLAEKNIKKDFLLELDQFFQSFKFLNIWYFFLKLW